MEELKTQPKHPLSFFILIEIADLAYFQLKAAIAEQDRVTRLQGAKQVLKIFDHHFNPDNKANFVPSESSKFTLCIHRLVSIPESGGSLFALKRLMEVYIPGQRLLLERNWRDKRKSFRRNDLIDFMHLLLKSLQIFIMCD